MIKQRLTALALMAAVVAPLPASGRELDRRTAVREALAQNPQIAAARAEEAAVKAQMRQVDAARWPMVNALGGVGPSVKATRVPGTAVDSVERQRDVSASDLSAVFLASVTAIQPLFTFGKIAYRHEATEHGLRARQAQTRMTKADLALEVARIYEGYLLARDVWRFFDETVHWLESTLQATQDKLEKRATGVTERDVLRTQAAISLAVMGRNRAQAGQAQAQAGLIAYLGLGRGTTLTFAEDELLPVGRLTLDFEKLVALAQDNRPELIALREGNRALTALSRAEAVGLAPDLFLLGFVELAYTPGRDWLQTPLRGRPLEPRGAGRAAGPALAVLGQHGGGPGRGAATTGQCARSAGPLGRPWYSRRGSAGVRGRAARPQERGRRRPGGGQGQALDGAGLGRQRDRAAAAAGPVRCRGGLRGLAPGHAGVALRP